MKFFAKKESNEEKKKIQKITKFLSQIEAICLDRDAKTEKLKETLIEIGKTNKKKYPTIVADILNAQDHEGNTILHRVADSKFLPSNRYEILLQYGASSAIQNKAGNTPLHIACENSENIHIRQESIHIPNNAGLTPLHVACAHSNRRAVYALLQQRANVASIDTQGNTPLHHATDIDIIDSLIQSGADLRAKNSHNQTIMDIHRDRNNPQSVTIVANLGQNLAKLEQQEFQSFCQACYKKDTLEIKRLAPVVNVTMVTHNKENALHLLCKIKELDVSEEIASLIHRGADVTAKNESCQTPLHLACEAGNTAAIALVCHQDTINAQDKSYNTPLYITTKQQNFRNTEVLVLKGADVNKMRSERDSPLTEICKLGNLEIATLLVNNGANVNSGKPLLHTNNPEIAKILLDKGADINTTNQYGSALHIASKSRNIEMVKLLLERGADVNLEASIEIKSRWRSHPSDPWIWESVIKTVTPLYVACHVERIGKDELDKDSYKTINMLLDSGANKEDVDPYALRGAESQRDKNHSVAPAPTTTANNFTVTPAVPLPQTQPSAIPLVQPQQQGYHGQPQPFYPITPNHWQQYVQQPQYQPGNVPQYWQNQYLPQGQQYPTTPSPYPTTPSSFHRG